MGTMTQRCQRPHHVPRVWGGQPFSRGATPLEQDDPGVAGHQDAISSGPIDQSARRRPVDRPAVELETG